MLTKADAIIKAADDLLHALAGNLTQNGTTKEAIKQLMTIFEEEAEREMRPKNVPQMRDTYAPNQRVQATAPSQRVGIAPTPTDNVLQIEYEELPTLVPPDPRVIS